MSDTPPKAQVEDDQASKASSEATAPQASPKKNPGSQFHHHVVPTEHCGAINVYVQVRPYFSTNPTFYTVTQYKLTLLIWLLYEY